MTYLTDPDFDKKMTELTEFMSDQQKKLLDLYDDGPDEFSPEAIFDL
jgi:hypothetical protein